MNFTEYQVKALSFALPSAYKLEYLIPALCEEAGEVAALYSKWVRKDRLDQPIDTDKMAKEIGDVMWNLAVLCHYFGLSLEDVAEMNIDKLTDRKVRSVIVGGGDNR